MLCFFKKTTAAKWPFFIVFSSATVSFDGNIGQSAAMFVLNCSQTLLETVRQNALYKNLDWYTATRWFHYLFDVSVAALKTALTAEGQFTWELQMLVWGKSRLLKAARDTVSHLQRYLGGRKSTRYHNPTPETAKTKAVIGADGRSHDLEVVIDFFSRLNVGLVTSLPKNNWLRSNLLPPCAITVDIL